MTRYLTYDKILDVSRNMRKTGEPPLGYLLYRMMTALRPSATAELRPLGLGLPEFVCMRILSVFPRRSSAELARDTNVSPQAMNQVLQRLENLGAVTRPEWVSSGNALPAELTSKGRSLLRRADAAVLAAENTALATLTTERRRELKHLLISALAMPVAEWSWD
jgi:DNA-binding MarR family transcriptional regulator